MSELLVRPADLRGHVCRRRALFVREVRARADLRVDARVMLVGRLLPVLAGAIIRFELRRREAAPERPLRLKKRAHFVLNLGAVHRAVVRAARSAPSRVVTTDAVLRQHLADGAITAVIQPLLHVRQRGQHFLAVRVGSLFAMRDVATASAQRVEHLRELSASEHVVQTVSSQLQRQALPSPRLQPGGVRVSRDEAVTLEELHAVLQAVARPLDVPTRRPLGAALSGEAYVVLRVYRLVEQMGADLHNLMIRHVDQREATRCNAQIETKAIVRGFKLRHALSFLERAREQATCEERARRGKDGHAPGWQESSSARGKERKRRKMKSVGHCLSSNAKPTRSAP